MKLKITAKELRAIGFPESPIIPVVMSTMEKNYKHEKKEVVMELLQKILASPIEYKNDAILGVIAERLLPKEDKEGAAISLNNEGVAFSIYGK